MRPARALLASRRSPACPASAEAMKSITASRVSWGTHVPLRVHTVELNDIGAFHYLVTLQRHHQDVARDPSAWLPWNDQATLAGLDAQTASPA